MLYRGITRQAVGIVRTEKGKNKMVDEKLIIEKIESIKSNLQVFEITSPNKYFLPHHICYLLDNLTEYINDIKSKDYSLHYYAGYLRKEINRIKKKYLGEDINAPTKESEGEG